jgi:NAD(P)-binding Rossmann-like domain
MWGSPVPTGIDADYVVVGAGTAGLAFTDTLVRHGSGTVAIIDSHANPGGHWNDAYSFVRLHLPSHYYGVNSIPIEREREVYREGLNRNLHHLATASELLAYYRLVIDGLLATGRVTYWPMTMLDWQAKEAISMVSGTRRAVAARKKLVNGTASGTRVPAAGTRPFAVIDDANVVAIRELPVVRRSFTYYCVIGGGKTGADACLWLLENGVEADRIRWIVPRDAWWINRAKLQFTDSTFDDGLSFMRGQMDALADATSPDDIFPAMEARGLCFRLDTSRTPTQYHMASMSPAEHDLLQTVTSITRLGHLKSVSPTELLFESGREPAKPDTLYVDCSQNGIGGQPPQKLFDSNTLSLSWTRPGRPSFSAAILGLIEANGGSDEEKNALAMPVPVPRYPGDLLHIVAAGASNTKAWMANRTIADWIKSSRLDPMPGLLAAVTPEHADRFEGVAHLQRATTRAMERLPALTAMLGTAPPHLRG